MAGDSTLLLKMMEQLRDDFQEEREASRQSRARLHERMDAMADDVGAIKGDIRILGEVDGQVRGEVQGLKDSLGAHQSDVEPTIEAWRDLLKTGKRISWVFGIAGISTIGGLIAAVTGAWEWLAKLVLRQ